MCFFFKFFLFSIFLSPAQACEVVDLSFRAPCEKAVSLTPESRFLIPVTAFGDDAARSFKGNLAGATVSAVAGSIAGDIGDLRQAQVIDAITHKLLHGVVGGLSGAALSGLTGGDVASGAASGAVGAVVATTLADIMREDANTTAQKAIERAKEDGVPCTEENLRAYVAEEVHQNMMVPRLSSALSALLLGYDVDIAFNTGDTAVRNNCETVAMAMVMATPAATAAIVGAAAVGVGVAAALLAKDQIEKALGDGENVSKDGNGASSSAPLPPDMEPDDEKGKGFKKRDFEKGDHIDIDRFSKRVSQSGQRARFEDPKSGDYIEKDFGAGSGAEHGGSFWKAYTKRDEPLGTFSEQGKYLRQITKEIKR